MSEFSGRQLPPGQQLLIGMSPASGQPQFVPAFSAASMSAPQPPLGTAGPLLFSQRQPLPKQLTAAIKSCTSLERLSQLFAAHQAVLNPIHIAAMITKLPKLDNSAHNPAAAGSGDMAWNLSTGQVQQLQLRQLLQQLLLRLKAQGCGEYSPRGVANIVWALAKLQCAPDPELRCMLLNKFCSQLPTAVPQDISNVLWGVAKITKERTAAAGGTAAVLQPLGLAAAGALSSPSSSTRGPSLAGSAISAQSWGLMGGPGSLPSLYGSGNHDAALAAAGSAPLLAQEQVRLLLQHLCQQLHTASVQTISNSLWAVVVLQQEHQWCMCNCLGEFQNLLSVFCRQPHEALPGHIQPVIRCLAQLATTCSNHAGDTWIRWQPPLLQQLLGYLGSQKEQMEMHHVSSVLRDVAQVVCLHLLRAKQLRDQQQQACGVQPSSSSAAQASSSPSRSSQPQQLNTISGDAEGEEVLARLAASGGPQDTSSTVVALAMLQPQLEQLGLQHGVAALCSMLPPAALPHLGEEASQRLLAATSAAATSQSAAAAGPAAATAAAATAAQHLQLVMGGQGQQMGSGMPPATLNSPSALAGSSSASNSSSSNVVTGGGGEGSSSCSTSMSASAPIVSQQPQQQSEPQATAAPAAPGFTALEGLMIPDAAEAAAAAAATANAASVASPVAGNSGGSLSSVRSLEQQQQQMAPGSSQGGTQGSGSMPQLKQQLLSPTAVRGSAAGTAAAAVSSRPPSPPPLHLHQLHGLAYAPASAGSSSEPLPLAPAAAAAAAGEDAASASSDKEEAAARQLTHNIANADSVYQLAEIFTAHSSVMDMIHITACITRLSKVLGTTPSAASQAAAASLLPLLGSKLLQVLPNASARGIANVLWGYGRLRNLPQSDLLPELLEAFVQQLPSAACRDSAVVLWSLARLTEGQGMAAVGVTPDLLSKLGRQVLDQLSVAAAAVMEEQGRQQQQQQQQQQQPPPQKHGAGGAPGKHDHRDGGDASAPPSSRDISNSLMALTRLGFVPESAAAAAAAAAGKSAAAASQPAPLPSADAAADDDQAAASAALEGLSLQAAAAVDQPQPAAKQETAATATAAAADSSDSQAPEQQQQQQPSKPLLLPLAPIKVVVQFLLRHTAVAKTLDLQEAATALKQLGLQELSAQVAAAICSPSVPGGPGQHVGNHDQAGHHHGMGMGSGAMQYRHSSDMQCFHHHMGAGPGMQQHGFGGGGRPGGGGPHMYGVPGLTGRASSGGYGPAAAAAAGAGGGGYGSSASGAVLARTHPDQPGPYQQPLPQQPRGAHTPSVSMPSTINLSGTQLAGLLQQQRRQQPLPMSGSAYGAGWLPGKSPQEQQQQQQHWQGSSPGSSGAACVVPGVDSSGLITQQQIAQHQHQQYRMYMPGGSSGSAGSSPAIRRMTGGAHQGVQFAADASQAGPGYMSGPAAAGGGLQDYMQPGSMQQQQLQHQQQYQRRQQQQHGHQEQWGQMGGQPVRRPSGAQQTEVVQQQLQQQQGYGMLGGHEQGGVQYVFVPQQYNAQQQQQQQQQEQRPGTYLVPQQGMQQQQQQPDVGVMMQQVLQQQGGAMQQAQQQQQQPGMPGQQQMAMVPVSVAAAMLSMGQTDSSLPGQQQQQGLAAPGVVMQMQQQQQQASGGDAWLGQGFAAVGQPQQQQQQQQQSQQLMQMLPQIQAAATAAGAMPVGQFGVQCGGGGPVAAAAAVGGMPYQVSGSMLVGSTEYAVPVAGEAVVAGQMTQILGSGSLSADYATLGLAAAPAQQQQQVYGVMTPGAGGGMLQQQGGGMRVGLDPAGLYMQQQPPPQQPQDTTHLIYGMVQPGMTVPQQQQQQQQQAVVMMPPGGGYSFHGGQYQQQ